MKFLRCVCLLLAAVCALAQARVTAEQLVQFIQTSIRQKDDDGKVAKQVQMLKLSTRLETATVTKLQQSGAGPKTVAALTRLVADSANLSAATATASPKTDAAAPPPPSPEEWKKIVDSVRETALAYTESLPNFICSQVTERQAALAGSGDWRKQDTILEKLSYNDHQENYKVVMINDRVATDKKHEDLGGTTSSGEFGSIMRTIFDPRSGTEFGWSALVRLSRPNGERVAYRMAFRVAQHLYSIDDKNSKRSVSVGYHGLIWADQETSSILRIKFDCDDIPADFPVKSVALDLNYDFVEIAGQKFALPIRADIRSHEDKFESWNQNRYANYQKFGTDTTITFDTPDVSPDKLDEKPVVKKKQ